MPVLVGSAFSSWLKASSPPAEAPIPTIGKRVLSDDCAGPLSCGDSGVAVSGEGLGDALRGDDPLREVLRLISASRPRRAGTERLRRGSHHCQYNREQAISQVRLAWR